MCHPLTFYISDLLDSFIVRLTRRPKLLVSGPSFWGAHRSSTVPGTEMWLVEGKQMEKTMCLGALGRDRTHLIGSRFTKSFWALPWSDPGFSLPHIHSTNIEHLCPVHSRQLTRQRWHSRGKVVFSEATFWRAHVKGQKEESGAEGCHDISCVLSLRKMFALHFFSFPLNLNVQKSNSITRKRRLGANKC